MLNNPSSFTATLSFILLTTLTTTAAASSAASPVRAVGDSENIDPVTIYYRRAADQSDDYPSFEIPFTNVIENTHMIAPPSSSSSSGSGGDGGSAAAAGGELRKATMYFGTASVPPVVRREVAAADPADPEAVGGFPDGYEGTLRGGPSDADVVRCKLFEEADEVQADMMGLFEWPELEETVRVPMNWEGVTCVAVYYL